MANIRNLFISDLSGISRIKLAGGTTPDPPSSQISQFMVSSTQTGDGFYATIQEALDAAAVSGVEYPCVYVPPGIYTENITMSHPQVTLLGVSDQHAFPGSATSTVDAIGGTIIRGTITIDAPKVIIDSIIAIGPVDEPTIVLTSNVTRTDSQVTEVNIRNSWFSKHDDTTDLNVATIDASGVTVVTPFFTRLNLFRTTVTAKSPSYASTGVIIDGGNATAGIVIQAIDCSLRGGTLKKSTNRNWTFIYSTVYSNIQLTHTAATSVIFYHCLVANASATPFIDVLSSAATTIRLSCSAIQQIDGGNWIVTSDSAVTIYLGDTHFDSFTNTTTKNISGSGSFTVTTLTVPS
jgi:hypothetical protein